MASSIPNLDRVGAFVNQIQDMRAKSKTVHQGMAALRAKKAFPNQTGPDSPLAKDIQALHESNWKLLDMRRELTPADREAAKTQLKALFGEQGRCFVEKCSADTSRTLGGAVQTPKR